MFVEDGKSYVGVGRMAEITLPAMIIPDGYRDNDDSCDNNDNGNGDHIEDDDGKGCEVAMSAVTLTMVIIMIIRVIR